MKNFIIFFLVLININCATRKTSDESVSEAENSISREGEYGDINNQGTEGIIVFALDTNPNSDSLIYRKIIKRLGFKYKMFREEKGFELPERGEMFRQALWYHRNLRYISELKKLPQNDIVIISDVRDVVFFGTAQEVMNEFHLQKKKILISSTFQCCAAAYISHIKDYAKSIHQDWPVKNDAYPTKEEQSEVKKLWDLFFKTEYKKRVESDPVHRDKWASKEFIEAIEKKSNYFKLSNNQFANAGTIIGFRDDFLKVFAEINPKPWSDDEEEWNKWLAKLDDYETYSPDFLDNIFGIVTSLIRPQKNELAELMLETLYPTTSFPYKTFFRFTEKNNEFVSYWGGKTKIFHCPGCKTPEINVMRKKIVSLLNKKYPDFNKIFTLNEINLINN